MADARQKSKSTNSARRGERNAVGQGESHRAGWLAGIVIALLTARFLLPTEASVDGETLWLVQAWTLAVAVWAWRQYLAGRPMIRWDLGTLAVGLLVAGHVVSGLVLFSRGGEKRSAVNLMWEWASLGITFLVVRSLFAERSSRTAVIRTLTCVGIALAGLGLYQHYVVHPRTAEEFRQKRRELDELQTTIHTGTESQRFERRKRMLQVQEWFVENEIPMDGPGRKQMEYRIFFSTEPFGTFALTNTFAGLLVVVLFPALAIAMSSIRSQSGRLNCVIPVTFVLIVLWCLILTKSRTAWVGGIGGGVVWWFTAGKQRPSGGKWVVWASAAVLLVGGIVTVAAVTGGLDRKVISESTKSLQYRWQYWQGTAGVLREFPVFGSGPGNFRQHYVTHKLPESSEEIKDPHNLFLDAWCSGGVIALAGLLLLFVWTARNVLKHNEGTDDGHSRNDGPSFEPDSPALLFGLIGGFVLVILYVWFVNAPQIVRLWGLLAATIGVSSLMRRGQRPIEFPLPCLAAAAVAISIHLCGAGGFEMPAISQLLLVTVVAVTANPQSTGEESSHGSQPSRLIVAIGMTGTAAVLFGACLSSATIPVITREAAFSAGRPMWRVKHQWGNAARLLETAANNDPLSPQPVRELADLKIAHWQRNPKDKSRLERAIALQKAAIELDPYHYTGYWMLGKWYAVMHDVERQPQDKTEALKAYRAAIARYPQNAALLADYARVLKQTGEMKQASETAAQAIRLDDLNHREGHSDKFLPETTRRLLEELAPK